MHGHCVISQGMASDPARLVKGVAVVSDLGIHGGGLGSVFLFASFRRAVRLVGRAALVHLPQLLRLR